MDKTARQIQKEQTKETLLSTAVSLFSEQGILNTRMSDIAQAAGVSHGTVFLHFKTQEQLIEDVVTACCGKIASRTHELSASNNSLQAFLRAHLEGMLEYEPLYTRLVTENWLLPTGARDAWITLQSSVSHHFIRAAERDPSLKSGDIPPNFLFNLWIGLIHHYLANGDLFAPGESVLRRCGDSLIENYMKMIRSNCNT